MLSGNSGGRYLLFFQVVQPIQVTIGKLGKYRLPAGWYVYAGKHRQAVRPRVCRHLKPVKQKHWHIDYLTTREEVTGRHAWWESHTADECGLVRMILENYDAGVIVPGFGSSDCREGCASHLIYLNPPAMEDVKRWCLGRGGNWESGSSGGEYSP